MLHVSLEASGFSASLTHSGLFLVLGCLTRGGMGVCRSAPGGEPLAGLTGPARSDSEADCRHQRMSPASSACWERRLQSQKPGRGSVDRLASPCHVTWWRLGALRPAWLLGFNAHSGQAYVIDIKRDADSLLTGALICDTLL